MMRVRDLGPDPSPDALTNRLREIRSDVNRWQQWYADNSGPAVQEFSSLWEDDLLSQPYQCSHLIQHYLSVSTDSMDTLLSSTLLEAADGAFNLTTRPHGQLPLIRTALECASMATCLLGDGNQNSRITSRLSLAMEDIDRQARTQELGIKDLARTGRQSQASAADIREQKRRSRKAVLGVARSLNIPRRAVEAQMKMRDVVERAGHLSGEGREHFQFLWNVLAGASHGSRWASQSLLQYDITDDDPSADVVTVTSTLSPWVLVYLIDETHGLQRHAWERWEVRASPNST